MALTHAQKLTLRAAIQANATVLAFAGGNQQINTVFGQASLDAGDAQLIAGWYNQLTDPAFWGYPASVAVEKIINAVNPGEYTALAGDPMHATNGPRNSAATNLLHNGLDLVLRNGVIRPGTPEVRTWLTTIFPSGTAPVTRAAILAACTKIMNNVEKVFKVTATGPAGGDGSAQNVAANLPFEGTVTANDIQDIHGLTA